MRLAAIGLLLLGCSDDPVGDSGTLVPRDARTSIEDRGILDAAPDARTADTAVDAAAADATRADGQPPMDLGRPDIAVEPPDGAPDMQVDATPPDAAPPDPCAAAIDLNAAIAERGFYDGDTREAPAANLGTCGGAAGGEVLFRYQIAADTPVVVFATDYPETTAATVLYLRAACDDAADLACSRGNDADPGTRLAYEPGGPELVYLLVDTGSREGGGPFRLTAGPPPGPACGDGRDNDGDGLLDLEDPGCEDAEDDSEGDPLMPPTCSDGIDNDEDGAIDFPADPDCLAAGSNAERGGCVADEACDGRNQGPDFQDNSTTGGPWLSWRWTPDQDAEVTRLELFSGERAGATALSLHVEDAATQAPGQRLGRGAFALAVGNGWQGADLDAPALVAGGQNYWIVWETVANAQSPFALDGPAVDYRGSFDQGRTWNGPFQTAVKYRVFCCGR